MYFFPRLRAIYVSTYTVYSGCPSRFQIFRTALLLRDVLEEAYVRPGKRTRKSIQKITLSQLSWGPANVATFHSLQEQLRQSVTLSHRISDQALCAYTDASDKHWAAVVTQFTLQELDKSSEEQTHEQLSFLSSSFKDSQTNWTTFEKEANAIFQTFHKLDYLFSCEEMTHIFTDHPNLLFLYSPLALEPGLGRHIVSKVQRWGLFLAKFEYTIEHVDGEKSIMANMMTR